MPSLAFWNRSNDDIFLPNSKSNRDDCLACFRVLKSRAEAMGWECHTIDVYERAGKIPEVIIFLNIPHTPLGMLLDARYKRTKKWVILRECIVIRKINWNSLAQKQFSKIFTWNDALVDNIRYFKLNYAQNIPEGIPSDLQKEGFCTMIAGNKHSRHPLELYSERLAAIRWFEDNHPDEFDLYGVGWNDMKTNRKFWPFNKRRLRKTGSICYRGTIEKKYQYSSGINLLFVMKMPEIFLDILLRKSLIVLQPDAYQFT